MKKRVEILIRTEVDVEIDEKKISKEWLDEFSAYMWPVKSVDDIIKYVARYVTVNDQIGEDGFIEGIGESSEIGLKTTLIDEDEEIYIES